MAHPTETDLAKQPPLTAQEMAREEQFAMERKERGDKQAEQEFKSKLEGFINRATPDELRKFMDMACQNSPEAQKDYAQMKGYFNRVACDMMKSPKKTQEHSDSVRIPEVKNIVAITTTAFEEKSMVRGNPVDVLNTDAYIALQSYKDGSNPERLLQLLSREDLAGLGKRKQEARGELEKQKIYIVNSGNYPQGYDSAVTFHEEAFRKQEEAILAKHRPEAEAFVKSLNTDRGRSLVDNTEMAMVEFGMKQSIRA